MRRQYLPDRTISARNRSERRLFSLLRRLHGAYSFIIARSRVRFKHKYVTVLQSSNSRLCLTGNIFIFIVGNQALICISPPDCRVRSAHNRQGRVRRQCNRPSHAFERYGESLGSTSARAVSPAYASPVLPQDSSFPAQCKLAYCRRHFSHSSFPISRWGSTTPHATATWLRGRALHMPQRGKTGTRGRVTKASMTRARPTATVEPAGRPHNHRWWPLYRDVVYL
jgi:hypothetical protein